jgi:hypothetical protein
VAAIGLSRLQGSVGHQTSCRSWIAVGLERVLSRSEALLAMMIWAPSERDHPAWLVWRKSQGLPMHGAALHTPQAKLCRGDALF